MLDAGHHLALRGAVARQLVGDHHTRRTALALQELAQQAFCGPLVAPALDQNVEHDARLINGSPQPVRHAGDLEHDLVEVPFVTSAGQPAADLVGEFLAKLACPLPHGLVADNDAPCRQHLFDHAQAEREAKIQPDGVDLMSVSCPEGVTRLVMCR